MSFVKLPTEVLDQVCEEVGKFKGKLANDTLYSVALTSRTSLSSARRELYRSPLRLKSLSWPRALALLDTLSSAPHLAAHVQLLQTLRDCVMSFKGRIRRLDPARVSTVTDPIEWQKQVVCACMNLRHVSLFFEHAESAQETSSKLSSSRQLQRMKLTLDSRTELHEVFAALIEPFAAHPLLRLDIHLEGSTSTSPARRNYSVCSLHLVAPFPSLDNCLPYLPHNTTCLTALSISFEGTDDPAGNTINHFLAAFADNRLRKLSLSAQSTDHPLDDEA